MYKLTIVIFFGFVISACVSLDRKSSSSDEFKIRTKTVRYLYKVKYNSSEYPYALWSFPIRGKYDELHKIISIIPQGHILTIDSAKFDKNLYGPETTKFKGFLIYRGIEYYFTFNCSSLEYSQQFMIIP